MRRPTRDACDGLRAKRSPRFLQRGSATRAQHRLSTQAPHNPHHRARQAPSQRQVGHQTSSTPTVTGYGTCFARLPTIVGTMTDDRIQATRDRDVIMSLGGDDHITGLRGGDRVCAGPGADRVDDAGRHPPPTTPRGRVFGYVRIDGGPGNDIIIGGALSRVVAGGGNDRVAISYRAQTVRLGTGDDTVTLTGADIPLIFPGPGDDTVLIRTARPQFPDSTCVLFGRPRPAINVDLAAGTATGEGKDRLVGVQCAHFRNGGAVILPSPSR